MKMKKQNIIKSRAPPVPGPARSNPKQSCSCGTQFSTICFRILAAVLVLILLLSIAMLSKERKQRLIEQTRLDHRLARLSTHVRAMDTAMQRQRYFSLAAAGDELKKQEIFSQLLVQDIEANQFQDCGSAQILLAAPPADLDLPETLTWLSLGLAIGLATNRLLLVPTERLPWASPTSDWRLATACPHKSYLCFFQPWTDCQLPKALSQINGHRPVSFLNATGTERVVLFDLAASIPVHWSQPCPLCWAAFPARSPFFLPTACPDCVFSRSWYLGQLVAWLARPNPTLANLVAARKVAVGWLAPLAGFETSSSVSLPSLLSLHSGQFRHYNWFVVGPVSPGDGLPDAPYRNLPNRRPNPVPTLPTANVSQQAVDLLVDLLLLGESHVLAGSTASPSFRLACRLARQRRYESVCYGLGRPELLDFPFVDH